MTQTPDILLDFDGGTLVLHGPRSSELPHELLDLTWDPRVDGYRGMARQYRSVIETLTSGDFVFEDRARNYANLDGLSPRHMFPPFEHQEAALEAWKDAGRQGVVVLPTGSGKTYVAQLAMLACKRDTLVVVPTLDLLTQWLRTLERWLGTPVGAVGGGDFDVKPVTIITYDSAARHMDHLGNRFGLVIFDECHHLPGPIYSTIADTIVAPFRLGLTATFSRPDGGERLVEESLGPVVFESKVSQLAGDILAPYRVVRIGVTLTQAEQEEYQTARNHYLAWCRANQVFPGSPSGWRNFIQRSARSPAGRAAFKSYLRQRNLPLNSENKFSVLGELLEQHAGDRIIIFTHINELAYRISRQYLIPVITHQSSPKERAEILERFGTGSYPAVVTSKVLNEGVDVPEASVGIVISGSSSVREHVQRLGRILRRGKDKQATLYEMVALKTHEEFMSKRRRKHEAYGGKEVGDAEK